MTAERECFGEVLRRSFDVTPVELILIGKCNGVDQKIDAAPSGLYCSEGSIDRLGLGYVAVTDDNTTDFVGQRFDKFFQRIALVCKCKIVAMSAACFCNPPGKRPVVGDPHDQAAFAVHEG